MKARYSRRLSLENLERRELLAGNIMVAVNGGSVTVTGDSEGNEISIYQQLSGRFNIIADDGEEIIGPSDDLVIRNLTVNLGGGDDRLNIGKQSELSIPGLPAQILGVTTVNMGSGRDRAIVLVNGRQVGSRILPAVAINIDSSAGSTNFAPNLIDDELLVAFSSAGLINLRSGAGNDIVEVGNVQTLNLTADAGPQSTVAGLPDNDFIGLDGLQALNATVSAAGGNNDVAVQRSLIGTLTATGGNAVDSVRIWNSVFATNLTVRTNAGADTVDFDNVQIGLTAGTADLLTDLGIAVPQVPFGLTQLLHNLPSLPAFLTISTGDGNDSVELNQVSSTLAIYVYLDGGNDELRATTIDSTIAWFFGGLGVDGRLLTDIDALSELELQFENVLEAAAPNDE